MQYGGPFSRSVVIKHINSVQYLKPGSLARTCNVATDRLVYEDVRGLSATETCPGIQIQGRTKPKDAGPL